MFFLIVEFDILGWRGDSCVDVVIINLHSLKTNSSNLPGGLLERKQSSFNPNSWHILGICRTFPKRSFELI